MKMINLNIADRIHLESLFPLTAGRIEMTLVRDMKSKIGLTPEEIRDFEIKDQPNGMVTWNKSKEQSIEIEFTPEQMEILSRGIQRVDAAGEVSLGMLALIEKIEKIEK